VPGSASAGARRGHFNTKDTKITKGTKKGCGAFAAEAAEDRLSLADAVECDLSCFAGGVELLFC